MTNKQRAITAEDILDINMYSDPQLSPDGKSFAFVSTKINEDKNYESHLFMQQLDDSDPKQWTFHHKKDSHPRFSSDGKQIVFQSTRSGLPQLWLLHTDGGEAEQLTFFKHGATQPYWTKDGEGIVFTASLESDADVKQQTERTEEERQKDQEEKRKQPIVIDRLKHKSDSQGFNTDDRHTQIILYDVEQKSFTQLTSGEHHHHFQDISPDGSVVIFSANLNADADYELANDLFLLNTRSKDVTKLTERPGAYGGARFSPDGNQVACLGHEYEYEGATLSELFIINMKTKHWYSLSDDWNIQFGDGMIGDIRMGGSTTGPVWDSEGERIFFIGTSFGVTRLYEVNLQGERNTIYENNNHVFGFSYDAQHNRFVIALSSPTEQGDFYLLEKGETELTKLTKANPFLDDIVLSEPEELTIKAEDGWEIQGWLMKPYGFEEGKKYPFILEIHGGPHAMYGQTFFHEIQLLAAKGYVVLYTNPRGSHGYGQKFVDAVRGDYGGSDYTDLMTAVDYALENFSFINKNRLGVTGGSYGGFMTNWIVGHTNRFKAAVTQRSITNWLSFYGVSDIGYFFTKWELGKELMEDPKKLWEFSPLKYAENVETPLLIVHGEQDLRCPIEQGEQLFTTLKHLRKDVQFVRFPGANHELSRSGHPDMRIERLNHIVGWFEKYLQA